MYDIHSQMGTFKKVVHMMILSTLCVSVYVCSYVVVRYCTLIGGRVDTEYRHALLKADDFRYEYFKADDTNIDNRQDDSNIDDEKNRLTGILRRINSIGSTYSLDSLDTPPIQDYRPQFEYLIERSYSSDSDSNSDRFKKLEFNNQLHVNRGIKYNMKRRLANLFEKIEERDRRTNRYNNVNK